LENVVDNDPEYHQWGEGWPEADHAAAAPADTVAHGQSPGVPETAPEPPAATPPRRSGRSLVLVVVVLLALVAQFLVVDRVAVAVAEREMTRQIRSGAVADLPCGTTPPTVRDVSIGGFPFLTQVLSGTFTDIGMTMTGLPTQGPRIERISAHIRGIHVPILKLLTGGDGKIRVDDMQAAVRMDYDDLNTFLAGQPGRIHLTPVNGGRRVEISATATIPILGDEQVAGVTTFAVHDNKLTLVPAQISLRGLFNITIPLGDLGKYIPSIPIPVGDLPFDLNVAEATTDASGLSLAATARNFELPTDRTTPQCRPTARG
jgi:hypothetical protein